MAQPRISIVTPSFNQAEFIEQTITSVLEQGYANLQYGVVDGGSTDRSIDIINRYRHRLSYVIAEPDRGQSDAINKGLARADGEIVAWLNSDDMLLPGTLHKVARHFREHPECDWLIASAAATDEAGNRLHTMKPSGEFTLPGVLIRRTPLCVPQPATFWRRRLTDRVGLLDLSLHHCMDFDLWCRFLWSGAKPAVINDELATYRFHPQSKSRSQQDKFVAALIAIERRYLPLLGWRDRLRLSRAIGYQQRTLALRRGSGRPWRLVLRRPWWLLSQQVRHALVHGCPTREGFADGKRPVSNTWEEVWTHSSEQMAAGRLEFEQRCLRWNHFRQFLGDTFGERRLRCVELGAGEGDFSVLLAQLGHEVTLVDFSDRALAKAKQRFEKLGLSAQFVKADLFEFSAERSGTFDVSVSLGLAEHFDGPRRLEIIEAHRRVLADGGATLISVPHALCLPYRLRKAYLQLRDRWPYGFTRPFTAGEIQSIAQRVGFAQCSTYNTGFAASVDACLLAMFTGRHRGWGDGPRWANRIGGWDVNLIARAA